MTFDVLDQCWRGTNDTIPIVVMSTANPFKFYDSALGVLDVSELTAGMATLDQFSQQTDVSISVPLATLKDKAARFDRSVIKEHIVDQVLEMLH